jgi:hypothetical protein
MKDESLISIGLSDVFNVLVSVKYFVSIKSLSTNTSFTLGSPSLNKPNSILLSVRFLASEINSSSDLS